MSLLNLIVSAALSISPNELSDLQKAAGTKHRDKSSSSVAAGPSASTFQHPIASSKADTRSSAKEQEASREKKDADTSVATHSPAEENEEDLPRYEDTRRDLPGYT
ncbi:uncharacterized protein RAG0_05946 [Rhynchosporium agropyri]|uniref:Uncharacterized protein n=1 Tax=Rhynchosporium agropyri TaxID=914238 RepID=A0A1E1KF98_9HELO|nr:uncharacterized protein RAG0_05946 [Rhynchosporium agropyri]